MRKTKIAVLVSGGGTNLQALLDAQRSGTLRSGEVVLVVSNNPKAYALQRAAGAGVETAVWTETGFRLSAEAAAAAGAAAEAVVESGTGTETRPDFEQALRLLLREKGIELIILAGFMRILSGRFTAEWPGRILNVHPSLIPAFCGKGYYGLRVHEEALRRGVRVTGATVHFVNEIPDGGEILLQKAVEVLPGDSPETLQRRVMEQAEWILLPQAAEQVSGQILESTHPPETELPPRR